MMQITLPCTCGVLLQVKESLIGQAVRCPKCQRVVQVANPTPAEAAPLPEAQPIGIFGFADDGQIPCPSCNRKLSAAAVICVKCGYNLKTGQKLMTTWEPKSYTIEMEPTWTGSYTTIVVTRAADGNLTLEVLCKAFGVRVASRCLTLDLKRFTHALTDFGVPSSVVGDAYDLARQAYALSIGGLAGALPRSATYRVYLRGGKGDLVQIYEGLDRQRVRDKMQELVELLKDVAGFKIERK